MINIKPYFQIIVILMTLGVLNIGHCQDDLKLPVVKGKHSQILKKYYKYHKKLSKLTCTAGTEQMFERLLKNYRGNGTYVPTLEDGKLDVDTIKKYLSDVKAKIIWIKAQRKNLSKMKNLINIKKSVSDLRILLNILLKQKKILYLSKDKKRKMNANYKSIEFYNELKRKYLKLLTKTPFFLPYNFPVDYLALRKDYDHFKIQTGEDGQKKANETYFIRKILEDGSARKDHSGNDLFLRTTISSLYLSFKEKNKYLTESQRYDLDYILKSMERYLKRGKKKLSKRFIEWEKRTERTYKFYKNIIKGEFKENGKIVKSIDLAKKRSIAKYKLKQFVMSRLVSVYNYWANKDELMRALFSIETILFNEVGAMDGRDALERADVAQVVINRFFQDEYAILPEKEPLYKNLYLSLEKKIKEYRFLNLLFKEGEFSFTFYYMSISVRIFCPSLTKRSKRLRHQNLKIGLSKLKKPDYAFTALRYFSRASMLGRIDMTKLWTDYDPVPERPGNLIKKNRKIKKKFKRNAYKLLYRFEENPNKSFDVIEINDETYVKEVGKLRFYKYRSPHMFKYFKKIKKN